MNAHTAPSRTVVDCYSFFAAFFRWITDYTDGKYDGDPDVPYETAQARQAEYLLDEVKCRRGSRLLDIGCGNGRILEAAKNRGALVLGITISPEQARRNNERGLPTILLDCFDLAPGNVGYFDCVVANGSLEHIAQLPEVIRSKQRQIYCRIFRLVHQILRIDGLFATTVIHFRHNIDPFAISAGVKAFSRGSLNFHFAMLERYLGGCYPTEHMLIECAQPYFKLVNREDATDDYRLTSEAWIRIMRKFFLTDPRAWFILLRELIKRPELTIGMMDTYLVSQSWAVQFRDWEGQGAPTYLFRDTWRPAVFD